MKISVVLFFVFLSAGIGYSQKTYYTQRVIEEPLLDGFLNEDIWYQLSPASDFIVNYPDFGAKSEFISECYLVYGSEALFVAGNLYDEKPDSVSFTLSQRDDTGNADWFGFTLDTYGKKQNAFVFMVTAAGVEIDGVLNENDFDRSWNAVWKSKVVKREFGWSFEIRIPYSAIRFPKEDIQDWKVNFTRSVRRNRQESYWNPVDPEGFGELQQIGNLNGVKGISPPLRLSFSPYLTSYAEKTSGNNDFTTRINGGMDVKYGISEAFTLDMTLIPDFGQRRSDDLVLNLTPFEVRFNENRQFFTEGTELFNIGNVFYSRRIGGRPYYQDNVFNEVKGNERVSELSVESPLINATKVSGRTTSNLGIGVFNAVEGQSFATITDTLTGETRQVQANPYTNYNVVALSQNLKNNSTVNFLNTNVLRSGKARDANVSVLQSKIFSKDRTYLYTTSLRLSNILENGQNSGGHTAFAEVSKVQGIWRYSAYYYEESDTFEPNDLGFLQNNNSREFGASMRWNDFKPKGRFLRKWVESNVYFSQLYFPVLYDEFVVDAQVASTFKNFLTAGINAFAAPFGQMNHFESRSFGNPVFYEPAYGGGWFYSSDYSKKFALDVRGGASFYTNTKRKDQNIYVSPRLRVSDQFFLVLGSRFENYYNDFGYVAVNDELFSDQIILGTRNRQVVNNTISAEFLFTNRMGIDLQLRHYWQNVEYVNFNTLGNDALRQSTAYIGKNPDGSAIHDIAFNVFSIDLNYTWVFIPGSELRLVYKNNILTSKTSLDDNYFDSLTYLFSAEQVNSLSLRFLVFVDALYFKADGKKRL